jgi:glycosyltransferase involved in cell wall biosynthesis
MRILLLSRYDRNGASSRYRFYQYLPSFSEAGIEVECQSLLDDRYLDALYSGRGVPFFRIFNSYIKRLIKILNKNRYDLLWIEGEVFPWIPIWIESVLLGRTIPYVVDYDDAAFHRYDQHKNPIVRWILGNKIDQIMKHAAVVIAGNRYLADRAKQAGAKRIEIIPTVVDLNRYPGNTKSRNNKIITIGWIGTPWTARYLEHINPVLIRICEEKKARVVLVGASSKQFSSKYIEVKPWSEASEVEEIENFDIGIMDLPDSPWERGKCGLKLIQYMACGRPVIGSPIGVNRELILDGINGLQVSSDADWYRALQVLLENEDLRVKMGQAGRKLVEEKFSLQITLPKVLGILKSVEE